MHFCTAYLIAYLLNNYLILSALFIALIHIKALNKFFCCDIMSKIKNEGDKKWKKTKRKTRLK